MEEHPAQPLVYAGYSGRSLTAAAIEAKRAAGEKRKGLRDRLYNHATGRRSGDQFAVYVADRFVLPTLSAKDIADIAQGRVSIDEYVRNFVTKHLAFRWVETPDGKTAVALERLILQGDWKHGTPLLNSLE